jgi:hypothetical protein
LALAVLSYLSLRPMHPYELGRPLREHDDARSIKYNHGSLYMVVDQLAQAGFVCRGGDHAPEAAAGTHHTRAYGCMVEEEYRLALLEAETLFVERFIAQITDPDNGWGRPWAEFHGGGTAPYRGVSP